MIECSHAALARSLTEPVTSLHECPACGSEVLAVYTISLDGHTGWYFVSLHALDGPLPASLPPFEIVAADEPRF